MNYFLLNQNKELSTEELLNHVWQNDIDANADVSGSMFHISDKNCSQFKVQFELKAIRVARIVS